MTKRKSPVRHKVKTHTRKNRPVREYIRGKGKNKIIFHKRRMVILKKNPNIRMAFALVKKKLGWIDDVNVIEQSDIKGHLISPQGWDVTGFRVHGYSPEEDVIIVPNDPDTHEIIHEYGHHLYHKFPILEKIKIPASYPIETKEGRAEIYNVIFGSNDEWFAYHFPFWIKGKTQDWHPLEKEIMGKMMKNVKLGRK